MAIEATATDFDQQVTGPLTVVDFGHHGVVPAR